MHLLIIGQQSGQHEKGVGFSRWPVDAPQLINAWSLLPVEVERMSKRGIGPIPPPLQMIRSNVSGGKTIDVHLLSRRAPIMSRYTRSSTFRRAFSILFITNSP